MNASGIVALAVVILFAAFLAWCLHGTDPNEATTYEK